MSAAIPPSVLAGIKETLGANTVALPTPLKHRSSRRATQGGSEQDTVVQAINRLRVAETEMGGVALPPGAGQPSSRHSHFAPAVEPVEAAG